MDSAIVSLMVTGLITLILYGFIYASEGDQTIKGRPSTVDQISAEALLNGHALWQITIERISGNIHDIREVHGEAEEAIAKALASCRRAGIYSLIVTKDEPAALEFYRSNQEARGRAIGGFRIMPLGEVIVSHDATDYLAAGQPYGVSEEDIREADGYDPATATFCDDREGPAFPEQDVWDDSIYELGDRPWRCVVRLGFNYTDRDGASTTRQIQTKAFVPWMDEDHLVLGFCTTRKSDRSFVTSRMEEVVDLETGECIEDLDDFLKKTYEESDYRKIDDFFDNGLCAVNCLLYLADLDGDCCEEQKEIIYNYISDKIDTRNITSPFIETLVDKFCDELTPQQFRELAAEMHENGPQQFAELVRLGGEIIEARRGDAACGAAALAAISGATGPR